MKTPKAEGAPRLDVSWEELEALLEQGRREPLREDGYQKLRAAIRTLHYVTELLEKKGTTLAALRELLCPASTEKTEKVLQQAGIETGEPKPASSSKKPRTGHGCIAAAAYRGAKKIPVPHASLKPGDACPDGCGGKVYPQREPGVLVRIKGSRPWRRRSTSWKSCAATCAATCTPPPLRRKRARKNMTRQRSP
jgi:hypothetical protein